MRWLAAVATVVLVAALVAALFVPALNLLDPRASRLFAAPGRHPRLAAVYLSGDMGLAFGMGPKVAPALAAHGIPVFGVSSPVGFATRRSRGEVDAIVAGAVRAALARTGAERVVLMGQSFGADMAATAAPDLPPELRRRIAAILLVVPARTVFFRADPTGIAYLGTPDGYPAAALDRLGWAPVICIHGLGETDSLCPMLRTPGARVIGLPGGHFLQRNDRLLVATIIGALHALGLGVR